MSQGHPRRQPERAGLARPRGVDGA
jgi:hypothetical protein